MTFLDTFACITTDTGVVADILHVSPMFMRCGPRQRGSFGDGRLQRTRRTDARHARRGVTVEPVVECEPDFRRGGRF